MRAPKMDRPGALARLTLAICAKHPFDPAAFWAGLLTEALAGQEGIEVIVAHDGREPIPAPPGAITQLMIPDASVFRLWGAAIAQASADYVAVMDISAPPHPEWLHAMLNAIQSGGQACYGPVETGYQPGDRRIIGYLIEYAQFHRPVAGHLAEIPGNNFVLRRAEAGEPEQLRDTGFSKTAILNRWAQQGRQPPVLVDAAIVEHRKPFDTLSYFVRRYRHGRCYAADRVVGLSLVRRIGFAMRTPLLPFVRVNRIRRHAARVPKLRSAFRRFVLTVAFVESAWSFGELMGYLAGEGGCRALLD